MSQKTKQSKVAIVYLSYYSDPYLADMVKALAASTYPRDQMALVIVDNPHPVHGPSIKSIDETVMPLSGKTLPDVVVLPQEKNLGYCEGNNVGINWALEHGFDYIFLHNQDGYFAPECIGQLVEALEADQTIGCASALIMLHGQENKVNTAGNSFNYLGFGYVENFGKDLKSLKLNPIYPVGYVTGAGLMLRSELVKKYGPLDNDLFLYHEDVEYSLRLKILGYKTVVVSKAVFYHKYEFNRSPSKFYFMERNRYAVLLMYYRWPTLLLLLPILIMMELGLLLFFIQHGWFKEKVKMYAYWFNAEHLSLWLKKRKYIQGIRKLSDRQLLHLTSSRVYFGEKKDINSPLLLYVANPLMIIYRAIVQVLIFW